MKYNYEVSVNENRAKLNKDIFLFRGNRNIHYYFSIKGARFAFKKEGDLIENANAIYAAVTVIKPNGVEVANAIAPVENGLIHLKVTEDLIDEEVEVGDFDLVFDLFDDTDGAVTIPKVIGQFHVLERPCTTPISELVATNTTNEVDQALTDYAIVTYAEPVASTNADGTFAKKTWVPKEKITTAELNRMEEGISDVSSQCKEIANNQPTDLSLDSATNLLQLVNSKGSKLGNGITLPISSGGGTSQYLHIKYSSTGAPQLAGQISDTPNAYIGLCVDTNADSPTNPKNYTWYNWKGDNGDTGATPNLQIGTVTTLESGSNATASITGTTENPVLNLGIPKGDKGDTGASGTGTGGDTETWEKVIETTFGEECYAFTVTQDKDGNPLQLKEGFIFLTVSQPKDTGSNLLYGMGFSNWESSFNGKTNIYNIGLMKNYEFYRAAFYFKVINNYVFTQCLGNVRIGTTAPKYNVFTQPNIFNANTVSNFRVLTNSLEYVDKITVGLDMSTTGLFSADSIMEVWAKC